MGVSVSVLMIWSKRKAIITVEEFTNGIFINFKEIYTNKCYNTT